MSGEAATYPSGGRASGRSYPGGPLFRGAARLEFCLNPKGERSTFVWEQDSPWLSWSESVAVAFWFATAQAKAGDRRVLAVLRPGVHLWNLAEVMNDIALGEKKNMNLPGVKVDLPVLQDKDKKDLLEFGIPQAIDFVAASFVQDAEDIKLIRKTLGVRGRSIKIISKIENQEGINNIDQIIDATDGVMVARGDMGMEIDIEKVGLVQKMIISKCNIKGKFVVTATQMLDSMERAPRPTRAEATDVLNAVLDGTDVVMLSGETASGKFPEQAVATMRHICQVGERVVDYKSLYLGIRTKTLAMNIMSPVESVCSSAVKTVIDSDCKLIIALTETGHTARIISKYRPPCPILAITASEPTLRQMLANRGVVPILTASFQGTDSVIAKALVKAKETNMVKPGDNVVALHGQKEECPGHTNLLKIVVVP